MFAFAVKTLAADRGKLLTALVGVVFSLVLVNIQGGLYFGLMAKASVLVDHCDADIWVGHRNLENVDFSQHIPGIWLNRIRGIPTVEQAERYIVAGGRATLPNGEYQDVWLIGSDSATMFGTSWSFSKGNVSDLQKPDSVTVDEVDAKKLGYPGIGEVLEINGHRAKIVAKTKGITGFVTTPYLFTRLETARRYSQIPEGHCSYLLVRARPGTDIPQLKQSIQQQLKDASVYTSTELSRMSRDYWMQRTGIGISFGAATLLGVLVGLTMIAQSLYALALDHLTDYATLKAIGAEEGQVRMVVVIQALIVALLGSTIGIVLVLLIQRVFSSPMAPIDIPLRLLCSAVVLVFGICLLATILPVWRIQRLDPAIVLQG